MAETVSYHARVIVTRTVKTSTTTSTYGGPTVSKSSEQASLNIGGSDLEKLIEKLAAHMQLLDQDDFTDNRQTRTEG